MPSQLRVRGPRPPRVSLVRPGRRGRLSTDRKRAASRGVFLSFKAQALRDPKCSALRRKRLEKDWTLTELANRAHLSHNSVWRAECDPAKISQRTWFRLAKALGVDENEIRPSSE
jgi:hypothetical protein